MIYVIVGCFVALLVVCVFAAASIVFPSTIGYLDHVLFDFLRTRFK